MNHADSESASTESTAETATHGAATLPGWELGWAQIVGTRHRITEDACAYRVLKTWLNSGAGLYVVVADGVGGGARGDVASQALAKHCLALPKRWLGSANGLATWMRQAEAEVQKALRAVTFSPGASTLAAAWLTACGNGHLIRVGDARLYRVGTDGAVTALTRDQTYAAVGETPPPGASGDDPARMVGTGFMGEPEMQDLELAPGEALLLCSDGLHRGINEIGMAASLQAGATLQQACIALAQAARAAGSEDDISVLVARRCGPDAVKRRFWRWLSKRQCR